MRVLVLASCRWLNAAVEGALLQARALAGAGVETAFAGTPGSPAMIEAVRHGIRCLPLRLEGWSFPMGLSALRGICREFAPDFVCAHRSEDHTAAVLLDPCPVVRVRSDIRRPVAGRAAAWVDGRTSLVVVPSGFMVREGYLSRRRGASEIIPQPVDTARFAPPAGRPEGVVVSAGRLSEVKGHRTLIRAVACLPGVRAVIAGAPAQQSVEDLRSFAAGLGAAERIEFPGRLEDMPAFYSGGTLGVVASLGSEAVSRAAAEMMASGLPVLAAATNGLVDLVADGRTGLLHPPGDWRTLSLQIRHLLDNPGAAAYLSTNAREFCEREISIVAVGGKWLSVLEGLRRGNKATRERVSLTEGTGNPSEG